MFTLIGDERCFYVPVPDQKGWYAPDDVVTAVKQTLLELLDSTLFRWNWSCKCLMNVMVCEADSAPWHLRVIDLATRRGLVGVYLSETVASPGFFRQHRLPKLLAGSELDKKSPCDCGDGPVDSLRVPMYIVGYIGRRCCD